MADRGTSSILTRPIEEIRTERDWYFRQWLSIPFLLLLPVILIGLFWCEWVWQGPDGRTAQIGWAIISHGGQLLICFLIMVCVFGVTQAKPGHEVSFLDRSKSTRKFALMFWGSLAVLLLMNAVYDFSMVLSNGQAWGVYAAYGAILILLLIICAVLIFILFMYMVMSFRQFWNEHAMKLHVDLSWNRNSHLFMMGSLALVVTFLFSFSWISEWIHETHAIAVLVIVSLIVIFILALFCLAIIQCWVGAIRCWRITTEQMEGKDVEMPHVELEAIKLEVTET